MFTDATPTVLRCTSTAEFLAALPHLTGFTANDSLFIVLFAGAGSTSVGRTSAGRTSSRSSDSRSTGSRSTGAMRIDLPAHESSSAIECFLDAVCAVLRDSGGAAHGPALVITTSESFGSDGRAPRRRLARALERRFAREGWPLRELALIAADGWAELLENTAPHVKRPLSDLSSSPITAHPGAGAAPPALIETLGLLPETDPVRAAKVHSHLAEIDVRTQSAATPRAPHAHGTARIVGASCDAEPGAIDPRLAAKLISAVEHPWGWLVAALTLVSQPQAAIETAEELAAATPEFCASSCVSSAHRLVLERLSAHPPVRPRLQHAVASLAETAAHAPHTRRPALLALIAWAWWHMGLSTVAAQVCEAALDIDPDSGEATMISRLIEQPPGWHRHIFDERSGSRGDHPQRQLTDESASA